MGIRHIVLMERVLFLSCFCLVSGWMVLESWFQFFTGLKGNNVLGEIQFYFAFSSLGTGCLFFFSGEGDRG